MELYFNLLCLHIFQSEDEEKKNFLNYLREIIIGTIQEIYLHSHNKTEGITFIIYITLYFYNHIVLLLLHCIVIITLYCYYYIVLFISHCIIISIITVDPV